MKKVDQSREPLLLVGSQAEKVNAAFLTADPSDRRQVDQNRRIRVAWDEPELQIASDRHRRTCSSHTATLQRQVKNEPFAGTDGGGKTCQVSDGQPRVLSLLHYSFLMDNIVLDPGGSGIRLRPFYGSSRMVYGYLNQ